MFNQTVITEFFLIRFFNIQELQILHFVLFLVLYVASLMGNLLIIIVIALDHHLHNPMYFFLMNLSILDLGSISVTMPKSMLNALMNTRTISYSGCITQVFFFVFFALADVVLLTVMAYDRYVAISRPLHYERVMNRRACVQMAAGAWILGIIMASLHTKNTFAISFCGGNVVDQFFCETSRLLILACSGSDFGENIVIFFNLVLSFSCLAFIVVSYVLILRTVLRITSDQGRWKAFSTCIPHLTVVSMLFFSDTFSYLRSFSSSASALDLLLCVLYAIMPPMMNPIIYSLRNKEIKGALSKLISGTLLINMKMSVFLH